MKCTSVDLPKQLEKVEFFKNLSNMLTNDARFTRDIKSKIAITKAAFNKKNTPLNITEDLGLRKKLVHCNI
jgi:hypothetical protein